MLTPYMRELVVRTGWAATELPWTPGERVLIVSAPGSLKEAREKHPGLVDYLLAELDLIPPQERDFIALKNIHLVKKHLGGRVRKLLPPGV